MDTMVILGLFGFVFHNDFLLGNTAFGDSTGMHFSGGVVISGKSKHEISDKPWRTKVMDCCFFLHTDRYSCVCLKHWLLRKPFDGNLIGKSDAGMINYWTELGSKTCQITYLLAIYYIAMETMFHLQMMNMMIRVTVFQNDNIKMGL